MEMPVGPCTSQCSLGTFAKEALCLLGDKPRSLADPPALGRLLGCPASQMSVLRILQTLYKTLCIETASMYGINMPLWEI